MGGGETRLDRLLGLLDTGDTFEHRRMAAHQIGQLVRNHPYDLQQILCRVHTLLRSDSFYTRTAAGLALGAIAENIPLWQPEEVDAAAVKEEETSVDAQADAGSDDMTDEEKAILESSTRLTFEEFDLQMILMHGELLLESNGIDYDDSDLAGMAPRERMRVQMQRLTKELKRMGGVPDEDTRGHGQLVTDVIDERDLLVTPKRSATPVIDEEKAGKVSELLKGKSVREQLMAKRRAQLARKRPKMATVFDEQRHNASSRKGTASTAVVTDQAASNKVVVEAKLDPDAVFSRASEWPFRMRCEEMSLDLFNPRWEVRHGAAIGLREILKKHGKRAGYTLESAGKSDVQQEQNRVWLEDMSLRLMCVLVLDRYADYSSLQVVAPVREMIAQTLGAVVFNMADESIVKVLHMLFSLEQCKEWEVRQGALLGIKYFVVTGGNLVRRMLPQILHSIRHGLGDTSDDVRACSGDALLPIMQLVVDAAGDAAVVEFTTLLWNALRSIDYLSASTESTLRLLSGFISCLTSANPSLIAQTHSEGTPLNELMRAFYPLFRHTSATIRSLTATSVSEMVAKMAAAGLVDSISLIVEDVLTLSFSSILIEEDENVASTFICLWETCIENATPDQLLSLSKPCFQQFGKQIMTAPDTPLAVPELLQTSRKVAGAKSKEADGLVYIAGSENAARPVQTLTARLNAGVALGKMMARCETSGMPHTIMRSLVTQLLKKNKKSPSEVKCLAAGSIVDEWASITFLRPQQSASTAPEMPSEIIELLLFILGDEREYAELTGILKQLRNLTGALLKNYFSNGLPESEIVKLGRVNEFSVEKVQQVVGDWLTFEGFLEDAERGRPTRSSLLQSLRSTLEQYHTTKAQIKQAVGSVACEAVVSSRRLPEKSGTVIAPLLSTFRRDSRCILQVRAAVGLANVVYLQHAVKLTNCVKISKNVFEFLQTDKFFCPVASVVPESMADNLILSLFWLAEDEEKAEKLIAAKRSGRKRSASTANSGGSVDEQDDFDDDDKNARAYELFLIEDEMEKEEKERQETQRYRTAVKAFVDHLVSLFGDGVLAKLPFLVDPYFETLAATLDPYLTNAATQAKALLTQDSVSAAVSAAAVLQVVLPALPRSCNERILSSLPFAHAALKSPHAGLRFAGARLLTALAKNKALRTEVMHFVVVSILPMLGDTTALHKRQGVAELCYLLTKELNLDLLPYIIILVVPIMARMSDFDPSVRRLVSTTFGSLVRLLPLEKDSVDPPDMPCSLIAQKEAQRAFLDQLLDVSKLSHYTIPVPVHADLRSYQQTGVDWLNFLNKYKLHGILCDDMGLGKTLQTICVMAASKFERAQLFAKTGNQEYKQLPSLVICPPILTTHWRSEILKFVDNLTVLIYHGKPADRHRLIATFQDYDVIVMSYSLARSDVKVLSHIFFNYCVLDEGHVIRNAKTELTKAIKRYQSNHRVILSGTPIQNNALELWSLFDFLMPGFLGTQREFQLNYAKPIDASRKAKLTKKTARAGLELEVMSEKEKKIHEGAALALENLHRQVLPFLLRRMKEDVLSDLPEKVIQDYTCDLSPLQRKLYMAQEMRAFKTADDEVPHAAAGLQVPAHTSDMDAEQDSKDDDDDVDEDKVANKGRAPVKADTEDEEGSGELTLTMKEEARSAGVHIFKELKILQAICNHPALLTASDLPGAVASELSKENLHNYHVSGKLVALRQLLADCGIGVSKDILSDEAVSNHRVLVFASSKGFLKLVAEDLFEKQLKDKITYRRLDGDVPVADRAFMVEEFKNDPTIDVLLLTKQIGGLGLNLTCADTVIFLEHSWNPMVDEQAMDRAYRLGQTRRVNVYRLICRDTIEDRIMSLQKFKLHMAGTIVSKENSSLGSMGTGQLLDLFNGSDAEHLGARGSSGGNSNKSKPSAGLRAAIEVADRLEIDYSNSEYSVQEFQAKLEQK